MDSRAQERCSDAKMDPDLARMLVSNGSLKQGQNEMWI